CTFQLTGKSPPSNPDAGGCSRTSSCVGRVLPGGPLWPSPLYALSTGRVDDAVIVSLKVSWVVPVQPVTHVACTVTAPALLPSCRCTLAGEPGVVVNTCEELA